VVGIPTLTALDPELGNTAAAGIGFAIPSYVVVDVAGQLVAHGRVVTPPSPNASPAAS
jgi:S1-C subfamily serine protease